jgi:hypothetical protein
VDGEKIQPQVKSQQMAAASSSAQPQSTRTLPQQAKTENLEGMLNRKHEWAMGKKASARSWHELYFILNSETGNLSAYKNQRAARDKPNETFHKEGGISLAGATCAQDEQYQKKPHVFRLRTAQGSEYLFQAHNEAEMLNWIQAIRAVSRRASGSLQRGSPGTSQQQKYSTLPAPQGSMSTPQGGAGGDPSSDIEGATPGSSASKKKFFTISSKKK